MTLYSDINTSKVEKFPKVYDIDSVWQSFINFMKTRKRQRFFRPDLGNDLAKDLLFEIEEEDAVYYCISTLTRDLNYWDPRITLRVADTDVELDYDNKIVKMTISFSVKGFEDQYITKEIIL